MKAQLFNPASGQAYQGDIVVMVLPDDLSIPSDAIKISAASDGAIVLGEGEVTGHRHAFYERATSFAPDRPATGAADAATGLATLWRSDCLRDELVRRGILTSGELIRGFLRIQGGHCILRHEEHEAISIPPGEYYVGGAREWDAGEVRSVAD